MERMFEPMFMCTRGRAIAQNRSCYQSLEEALANIRLTSAVSLGERGCLQRTGDGAQ